MSAPVPPLAAPLDVRLRPSSWLGAAVVAAHVLAAAVVLWLVGRQPWALVLLLPVTASALHAWRRIRLRAANAVVRLVWEADDIWRWYRADGGRGGGRLAAGGIRLPWLVILYLRPSGRRIPLAVALPADGVTDDQVFRRLRARLRLAGA